MSELYEGIILIKSYQNCGNHRIVTLNFTSFVFNLFHYLFYIIKFQLLKNDFGVKFQYSKKLDFDVVFEY